MAAEKQEEGEVLGSSLIPPRAQVGAALSPGVSLFSIERGQDRAWRRSSLLRPPFREGQSLNQWMKNLIIR